MATPIIVLDAGHALVTRGKQTPDGIKEWSLNDKVRDKVVSMLSDYDVKFIFPDRNEGETDESLASRLASYINSGAKAMVSIHHNAFKGVWGNHTGVVTYVDRNNTSADMKLAQCVHKRHVANIGLYDRGIRKENWWVINQNKVPAILTEGGFMDSSIDYPVITSDVGQTAYAKAIAEGLIEFCSLKKKSGTSSGGSSIVEPVTPAIPSTPSSSSKKNLGKVNITYQAYTDRWWDPVVNDSDWAGKGDGTPIKYFAVKVDKGTIRGRVYTQKNGWLPYLTFGNGYDLNDKVNGILGDGTPIQAIELYYNTPDGYNYQKVYYKVSDLKHEAFYAVQVDNETGSDMDGYAGVKGINIDKIQAYIK